MRSFVALIVILAFAIGCEVNVNMEMPTGKPTDGKPVTPPPTASGGPAVVGIEPVRGHV